MTKIQKVILIIWCVLVTISLIYVPLKTTDSNRTRERTGYIWESRNTVMSGWRVVVAPVVLKVAALTVVCGTGFLLTLKRKRV